MGLSKSTGWVTWSANSNNLIGNTKHPIGTPRAGNAVSTAFLIKDKCTFSEKQTKWK